MSSLTFHRIDSASELEALPKIDGQIIYTTYETPYNKWYIDVDKNNTGTVAREVIQGVDLGVMELTKSEYEAITDKDAHVMYFITDTEEIAYKDKIYNNYSLDAKTLIEQAQTSATNAKVSETNAKASETNAKTSETNSANSAKLSESWAIGGTGTRNGENTNNAKHWAEQAKASADSAAQSMKPATTTSVGAVKPDNVTTTLDSSNSIVAQELQSVTQAQFDAMTTKSNKIAYLIQSENDATSGTIYYNGRYYGANNTYLTKTDASNTYLAKTDASDTYATKTELNTAKTDASNTYATKEELANAANFDKIYPVGSIYMSVNGTNPSTLFGGTWELLKDRFLLGAGGTYGVGTTGGEAQHMLTINEMPSHRHNMLRSGGGNTHLGVVNGDGIGNHGANTSEEGGNQPHNNMPPYLAVYMWKRTA